MIFLRKVIVIRLCFQGVSEPSAKKLVVDSWHREFENIIVALGCANSPVTVGFSCSDGTAHSLSPSCPPFSFSFFSFV